MWTAEDIPDQTGRVAVVTGANGGLGVEVVRGLARRGATVVMAARDRAKADAARDHLAAEVADAALEVRELDLASLDSVRAFATALAADHDHLDVLVNNAGIMGIPRQETTDGFEMQIGVSHLGHFALTRQLLPLLLAAPGARVVSVTSFGRIIGRRIGPADPHRRGRIGPLPAYGPWRTYGDAKLANMLFAAELQRRLETAGAPVASLAANPGLSHTGLHARSIEESGGGFTQRFWDLTAARVGIPNEHAARAVLRPATDPGARGGELYGPRWVSFGPVVRRPVVRPSGHAGRVLWAVSERETGERFDVAAAVAGG